MHGRVGHQSELMRSPACWKDSSWYAFGGMKEVSTIFLYMRIYLCRFEVKNISSPFNRVCATG